MCYSLQSLFQIFCKSHNLELKDGEKKTSKPNPQKNQGIFLNIQSSYFVVSHSLYKWSLYFLSENTNSNKFKLNICVLIMLVIDRFSSLK